MAHCRPRREFLARASALGAASLLGTPRLAAAEPPPETTHIRIANVPAICLAAQYVAEALLHLEGFSQIEYVDLKVPIASSAVLEGQADFALDTAPAVIPQLDRGQTLVVLAGIHPGCYELFGSARVRALRDLKGKSIGVRDEGAHDHVFIASMLAYVGVDPTRDVDWVRTGSFEGPMRLFEQGKTDAFLGFAPQPQELRMRKIGHVIVDITQDPPWSQYFCCMLVSNRAFVENYPIATKKVLRALFKAVDICAQQPERVARYLAKKGFEPRYEVGLEVLKGLPYSRWQEANPEDTIRFYALRLYDVGMVETLPNKLIAQGTDWRFLNELKQELKA